ncbi:amidohydrolase family protein [Sphingobium naphthae]|jgi:imidazolonepropionase-like amidohydrolase|uniref:Amidohydrolase family protein n=1 Tax=Sphingobium naphthae TaxID=1886786 RepID=A0ABU3ZZX5_9SPHN|nr:amidohydrolase family protein [Sphingobium naphthae]MDV5825040.1 amidohydrolase family protein [Sphingobium naphthae]MEA3540824.1 amidohydrolase family protein [Pseudomonadota bacterium]PDH69220.1 MAG: amidohydrolase [Sphingomonadaceae bacterium MED-G03]
MRQLIHNCMIFDGTGSASVAGAVLIEDDRIAAILPADAAVADIEADSVIDGQGATLMPGMVDAHTHLTWGSSVEKIYHQFILPPEELKVAAWRNARVLLDHGFTSLYSAGALSDRIEPELARAIEAGETPGPRLIPSTIERSPEGGEGVDTGDVFNGRGPDAMRAFVAYCAAEGVKSLKLVISGEDALKPGTSGDVLYTDEEMEAAGKAAREAGLWIATHAYAPRAITLALEAGARVLYHCSYADDAAIDAMAAKKDEIFYAPGPGVSVGALEANPPPHIDMSAMKASAAERIALEKALVPKLRARGVRILIGGDYGFPFNPNGRNARDLEHFVTLYGYTPAEALSAATMLGGQLMGLDVGQVKPGYLADLLLVAGDPTSDVRILQDRDNIKMIMLGGRMHKSPAPQPVAA